MLPYDTGKFHGIPVGADPISARGSYRRLREHI